jgi:hypothetical protein
VNAIFAIPAHFKAFHPQESNNDGTLGFTFLASAIYFSHYIVHLALRNPHQLAIDVAPDRLRSLTNRLYHVVVTFWTVIGRVVGFDQMTAFWATIQYPLVVVPLFIRFSPVDHPRQVLDLIVRI